MVVFISRTLENLVQFFKKRAVSSLDEESKWTVHYTAGSHLQDNVFLPGSRPLCVQQLHQQAHLNLKPTLRDCDRLRKDGSHSSQCYSQASMFSSTSSHLSANCLDQEQDQPNTHKSQADPVPSEEEQLFSRRMRSPLPGESPLDIQTSQSRACPLPTPQERMREQAMAVPTDIVPINITGKVFDRQAEVRRSLIHSDVATRRTKKIKRRKTITGVPEHVQRELGTVSECDGPLRWLPGQFSTMSRVESRCEAGGWRCGTRDRGCQTEAVRIVPPSVRRIRSHHKGLTLGGTVANGDLCYRSLPRPGARVSLHSLPIETPCTLPRPIGKLQADGTALRLRPRHDISAAAGVPPNRSRSQEFPAPPSPANGLGLGEGLELGWSMPCRGGHGCRSPPPSPGAARGRRVSLRKPRAPPPLPIRTDSLPKRGSVTGRRPPSPALSGGLEDPWVPRCQSQSSVSTPGTETPNHSQNSSLQSMCPAGRGVGLDPWAYYSQPHREPPCDPPARPLTPSPDKPPGVTSPSSGYSSRCPSPASATAPKPRPRPKPPERKSSLLTSSISASSSCTSLSSCASDSLHRGLGGGGEGLTAIAPPPPLPPPPPPPPPLPVLPPPPPPVNHKTIDRAWQKPSKMADSPKMADEAPLPVSTATPLVTTAALQLVQLRCVQGREGQARPQRPPPGAGPRPSWLLRKPAALACLSGEALSGEWGQGGHSPAGEAEPGHAGVGTGEMSSQTAREDSCANSTGKSPGKTPPPIARKPQLSLCLDPITPAGTPLETPSVTAEPAWNQDSLSPGEPAVNHGPRVPEDPSPVEGHEPRKAELDWGERNTDTDSGPDTNTNSHSDTGDVFDEDANVFLTPTYMGTPSRPQTTEDLFAAIHRSKRRVLGRSEGERSRQQSTDIYPKSPPTTPTGPAPSLASLRPPGSTHRSPRRSNSDSFKALLLRIGSRPDPRSRMSAAEMLRHTDPRSQRGRIKSAPELQEGPGERGSPARPRHPHEEWALHEGLMPRGVSSPGVRLGRTRTPPSAASSKYGARHRIQSSPMTVICEGMAEPAEGPGFNYSGLLSQGLNHSVDLRHSLSLTPGITHSPSLTSDLNHRPDMGLLNSVHMDRRVYGLVVDSGSQPGTEDESQS